MSYIANENRYSEMKYKRCGNSGILLPRISLGLWHNFGSVDVFRNMQDIVTSAFDHGITHFDLANNYGPVPGSAEENFGKILTKELSAYRDELIISTKAGFYMWPGPYGEYGSRKNLLASLDQSLTRMGLDYVDIFYSHRFDPDTPLEETMGALHTAVRSGKALYAGISRYSPEDTLKASKILRELGTPCLIHQPCYSMLNRCVEDGLLEVLEDEGIGCIAFSPLAQGQLTDKYLNGIPKDSRAAKPDTFLKASNITPEILDKIKRLNALAADRGQTLAQTALAWVLCGGRVTTVLIGASSAAQIAENVKALDNLEFSAEELQLIDNITQ